MEAFERLESNVRTYCRKYPAVFSQARSATLIDETGKTYLDFLSGAGALNYGHNEPRLRAAAMEYLARDGLLMSLDMYSVSKREFLRAFDKYVLKRRGLHFKMQFAAPTGTNAVEAAMKLARKATGRPIIAAFTNGYHGMTLGSLAATGSRDSRRGAYAPLHDVIRLPYDGYFGPGIDTMQMIRKYLTDPSSGFEIPAAFLIETVQGEGGLNAASPRWFKELCAFAKQIGALVIVDDIQAGCGRCGTFFSFETLGAVPDILCLSKSLSGLGLPLSLVLMRRELDVWAPGEHTGTFRGNNLAFVTAGKTLECYWQDDSFEDQIAAKARIIKRSLDAIAASAPATQTKGRGMFQGLRFGKPEQAAAVMAGAFSRGLILETCGPHDEVVKLLPPLTIDENELNRGLAILQETIDALGLLREKPKWMGHPVSPEKPHRQALRQMVAKP